MIQVKIQIENLFKYYQKHINPIIDDTLLLRYHNPILYDTTNNLLQTILPGFTTTGLSKDVGDKERLLDVDFSYNHYLSIKNTEFMRDNISYDERAKEMFIVWKYISSFLGINNAKEKTLSSYAWRLICLSFLIKQGVVPCLRENMDSNIISLEGVNVWYEYSNETSFVSKNKDSVGTLLVNFIEHLIDDPFQKRC